MLHTTKETMLMYIVAHYGKDTSKEFAMGFMTILTIHPQDVAKTTRHAARLLAHWTHLRAKITNLTEQQAAI